MKREEEYQRRFLLDELNALTGYGSRSLTLNSLQEPAHVRRAYAITKAWETKASDFRRKQQRIMDDAKAEIRQAIAFRKYDEALRLINALKKKASK